MMGFKFFQQQNLGDGALWGRHLSIKLKVDCL
jgi:hypothetical protein